MEELIKIEEVKKGYKNKIVLEIPTLSFYKSELVSIVGNNGAGKTTLFKILLDLVLPNKGKAYIMGHPVAKSEEWKFVTSAYLDETFVPDYLSPEEYFDFLASLKKISKAEVEEILKTFESFLADEILGKKKLIRNFSKGNIQKIGIVGCFVLKSPIIILDEPYSYLDPTSRIILGKLLKEYAQKGNTILISSHDIINITEISDRIILMEKGQIIKQGLNSTEFIQEIIEYFHPKVSEVEPRY